ncbi:MAG TPA: GNAT family N-acetyltransferase [Usitatibacter sp.]|nr:GNAT family N-acetyltransferase [Usitatibacter sp.]
MISWRCVPFAELTPRELHDILQARAAVFVVEQACAFQDVDGADLDSWHLMGLGMGPGPLPRSGARGDDQALVAYARLIPPGIKFAEASIGRVVTLPPIRGSGMGRELMREALKHAERLWPGKAVRIGAQARLAKFYEDFGFVTASAPYDEDGILHLEMLRPASVIPDKAGQPVGQ